MALVCKLSNNVPKSPLHHFPNLPILDHLRFLAILGLALTESLLILLNYDLIFHFIPILCILCYSLSRYLSLRANNVFLVDFSCYKPPNLCRIPFSSFIEHVHMITDKESAEFMSKVIHSSGQGQETYLPPSLHFIPPKTTFSNSIVEAQMVLFPIMEDLLTKTGLSSRDIDLLIVNCSALCPSPSLSSIIVNKFKLKPNVMTFNLSGMGCSASMLAVDMAQHLLKVHKESNAVVLSTEILTTGWYPGNDQPKLVLNCVFRMGGAAILLTNRRKAQSGSKYKLVWASRDQRASSDKGYYAAFREEDSNGFTGVTLRKDVVEVASDMIRAQANGLGSYVLPITEKFKFVGSILMKRFVNKAAEIYVPNFKTIVKHFCLPVSGRPVIREIGKGLRLGEREMEPAIATLHRFGNQSSSSIWYELAYLEAKERVKKGERVWMLGMGSGSKCTSVVMECIRPISGESNTSPWADSLGRYPFSAFNQN